MKELLKDSIGTIEYKIFKNGVLVSATNDVDVTVLRNGVTIVDSTPSTSSETGIYTYDLPVNFTSGSTEIPVTSETGVLEVIWSFSLSGNQMTVSEYYSVITPYAPWEYFYGENTNYQDYLECERVARYVINWYCGQSFDKEYSTYAIEGHGENALTMPKKLIALEDISWLDRDLQEINTLKPDHIWELAAGGWIIRQQPYNNYIDMVYNRNPTFTRNRIYNVTGFWGYNSVPTEVQEAAKILIADLLCQDHKYRDRYLNRIKIDNSSWDVNEKAFAGTGNALVDNLLVDYRLFPSIGMI